MTGISDPDRPARRIEKAAVALCLAAYAALVAPLSGSLGVTPAEALPEITWPIDVISGVDLSTAPALVTFTDGRRFRGDIWTAGWAGGLPGGSPSRWVFSRTPPWVSVYAGGGGQLPVLFDSHATCHLSYAAMGAAELTKQRVWAPRVLVGVLGAMAIVLVHRIGRALFSGRTALLAAALAATGLPLAMAFGGARYDAAIASFGVLAVPALLIQRMRDGRDRWLWMAALCAGAAISGNLTAAVPLGALGACAIASGVPLGMSWKKLAAPAAIAALWLIPIGVATVVAPGGHAMGALSLDADSIAGLVDAARAGGFVYFAGLGILAVTLATLASSAVRAGPSPRRGRIETAMLGAFGMVLAASFLVPRPHRDALLVAALLLFSLPMAATCETLAAAFERALRVTFPAGARKVPRWAIVAVVACVPISAQIAAHARLRAHLRDHPVALLDRAAQRDLSDYLVREHIHQPITVSPAMSGSLELFSAGQVRPMHAFPMLEALRIAGYTHDDLRRVFRRILQIRSREPRFVILPGGGGPDGGAWAEAVRNALLAQAGVEPGGWDRVAAFGNAGGHPLFVVYRIGARPPDAEVTEPPLPDDAAPHSVAMDGQRERPASAETLAALGGLANGSALGEFAIESISEPFRGAIVVRIRRGRSRAAFELRRHTDGVLPVAFAGEIAIYYRRPERGVSPEDLGAAAKVLAARLQGSPAASSPPSALTALPSGGISL